MKLFKQIPSFTIFLIFKKNEGQMKIKWHFCRIKRKFEIHSNLHDLPSILTVYVHSTSLIVVQKLEFVL